MKIKLNDEVVFDGTIWAFLLLLFITQMAYRVLDFLVDLIIKA